jgi:hypothetical protein
MIEQHHVMPLLIEACPSYQSQWDVYIAQPEYEEGLLYVDLGNFAHHLVELIQQNDVAEFSSVFDVIERLHVEGDAFVREAATVGALESIQNVAGNCDVDAERFVPFLRPESAKWWIRLNNFWAGDSAALHEN